MKQFIACFLLFFSLSIKGQDQTSRSTFDINYFSGNIALHNDDILHLIEGHPEGFVLSWNKKTDGTNKWEQRYNYPDYGVSISFQDLKSEVLGQNYGVYGHYNFYFFNRQLMFRIGQGLAYTTNPYHKTENHKNIAFGSKIMSGTYAMINFKKDRIFDRFGIQTGLSLFHYSNGSIKAPNTSVNTITFNLGLNYELENTQINYNYDLTDDANYKESLKINLAFRSGINESDVVGSGQFPFYIFSAYLDKRFNRKSAVQLGSEIFVSNFLKERIYYYSVSFPEENIDPDTDHKRVGIFAGHELFINKLSIIAQFGYYVYYPYDFEGRTYQRIGLKRYLGDKWFGALTLRSHGAKAEAVEFGIGIRL